MTVSSLNEGGRESIIKFFAELIKECGLDVFSKLMFELKFPPKIEEVKPEDTQIDDG